MSTQQEEPKKDNRQESMKNAANMAKEIFLKQLEKIDLVRLFNPTATTDEEVERATTNAKVVIESLVHASAQAAIKWGIHTKKVLKAAFPPEESK